MFYNYLSSGHIGKLIVVFIQLNNSEDDFLLFATGNLMSGFKAISYSSKSLLRSSPVNFSSKKRIFWITVLIVMQDRINDCLV